MTTSTQANTSDRLGGGGDASPKKTVVLGVGNVLLSDEGVGVHVANKLMEMDLPSGIQVVQGGTHGFRLIDVVTGADRLVVVDAVKRGGPPGSIYRFDIKDTPSYFDNYRGSIHQMGIPELVRLSEFVGEAPETTIIGVEPKSLDMGMELSSEVEAKLPRIIELILEEIKRPVGNSA
jgi:hydrogenase maturation protease